MAEKWQRKGRLDLLADVAELYYLKGASQAEIAQELGVTRSMVSRMLTDAREHGMVKIQIERPINENTDLEQKLVRRFKLQKAIVIETLNNQNRLSVLARAAARYLAESLEPGQILGTSWGTAISATADELHLNTPIPSVRVVQLLGSLGARIKVYDGLSIVRRLVEKLDGEGIYLNAPLLVENEEVAEILLASRGVQETLNYGCQADVALLGIGSTSFDYSPYYLAGHVSQEELLEMVAQKTVGDVCGIFFDINGKLTYPELQKRIIGIDIDKFLKIPVRLAVAGGPEKINPVLGALRGNYINTLVTDANTAQSVLIQS